VSTIGVKRRNPVLVLTGERSNRRVFVRFNGKQVKVTYSQFVVLVRLVIARGATPTGFIKDADSIHPVAVWRLRTALDQGLGREAGKSLVETGAGEEYRLGIPIRQVALEPSCSELLQIGFLTAQQLEELRRLCRLL
jgi:hypothetical protein